MHPARPNFFSNLLSATPHHQRNRSARGERGTHQQQASPELSGRGAYYPNHIRDSSAQLPRFQSADPGKRRAVLRSLRNRRLQTAAGIAAPPRGSPTQLDRGTQLGDRGIVIDIRVTARPGRLAFQAAPAVDTQTWNL